MNDSKNKNNLSDFILSGIGILAGALGSVCSAGLGACAPVCSAAAFSLLGFGNAAIGTFMHRWQPLFIVVSLLIFAYVFALLYFGKKKTQDCSTGNSCNYGSGNSTKTGMRKIFFWAALLFSISFYVYPVIAGNFPYGPAKSGCDSNSSCAAPCLPNKGTPTPDAVSASDSTKQKRRSRSKSSAGKEKRKSRPTCQHGNSNCPAGSSPSGREVSNQQNTVTPGR